MLTHARVADVRTQVAAWHASGARVVLVPTMGNLHAGHRALVERGHARGDRVVVSIYVNPTQFGPSEDFARYPRTPDADHALLREAGCDLVFTPSADEMYPHGPASTVVAVPGLSSILCGAFRPGHFEGVATVVAKLFNIVDPDVAIFGEKDYQQLAVIRRMVDDLRLRVTVDAAATVRDPDGLALSSRNQYLTADERLRAPVLYRALCAAAERLADPTAPIAAVEADGRQMLDAHGFRTEYFAVRDAVTLAEPAAGPGSRVVLAAARLGAARLIDNIVVSGSRS